MHTKEEKFINSLSAVLMATVVLFVLGDIARKVAIASNFEFTRYTAVSKAIVLLMYLTTLCCYFRKYYKIWFTRILINYTSILSIIFLVGQLVLGGQDSIFQRISGNLLYFGRYSFWFFSLILFFPIIIDKSRILKHFKILQFVFFANIVLIFIAVLLDLHLFKTYGSGSRFGFMGLYNTSNQASYYFILFLLFYYYKAYVIEKDGGKIKFIMVVVASLFIGTKKIYFFLLILYAYHFFKFKLYKNTRTYYSFAAILLFSLLFINEIQKFLSQKFYALVLAYREGGFVTSFTSYRNELLMQAYDYVAAEWSILNYFTGGAKFYQLRPEFEVVDVYLFFGFFGCYVFYWIFESLYGYSKNSRFYLFVIFCVFVTSFFAAGFLSDANVPLLFILVSSYFIDLPQNALYLPLKKAQFK